MGLFCWPTDEDEKNKLIEKSGLAEKYHFLAFYDAMWMTLGVSVGFGIIYLILLQCFPTMVVPWTIFLGGVTFFLLGILTILYLFI